MRRFAAVSLVLLGACRLPGETGGGGAACFVDEECRAGEVCARDEHCWPASEVRRVMATWTVRGQPASEATCARAPDLHIIFDGNVPDDLGFSPVPCVLGQFVVDKLPRAFTRVELGVDDVGPWRTATITSSGTATFDLPL
ncbi:MAG TPA: hypothetical protein VK932_13770 [Kofleriaceae bacterium]|nr:hypothetical protein [Kofleriaceae bacterium]